MGYRYAALLVRTGRGIQLAKRRRAPLLFLSGPRAIVLLKIFLSAISLFLLLGAPTYPVLFETEHPASYLLAHRSVEAVRFSDRFHAIFRFAHRVGQIGSSYQHFLLFLNCRALHREFLIHLCACLFEEKRLGPLVPEGAWLCIQSKVIRIIKTSCE